jgi:hypothetical protein
MKIDIKPKIIIATDYHDFSGICDNSKELTGIKFDYYEINHWHYYRAIVWPEGAEDELFEFIFTNREAWEVLIEDQ